MTTDESVEISVNSEEKKENPTKPATELKEQVKEQVKEEVNKPAPKKTPSTGTKGKVKIKKIIKQKSVSQQAKEKVETATAPITKHKGNMWLYISLIAGAGLSIIIGLIVAKRVNGSKTGKAKADTAPAKNPAVANAGDCEITPTTSIKDLFGRN